VNAAGNLYQVGQSVIVNRDSLKFKGEVIGFAKKFTRPSIYVVELPNGEILRVNESEVSPHVVNQHRAVFYHIAAMIAVMLSILLFTRV
jgi:hypothetical protein